MCANIWLFIYDFEVGCGFNHVTGYFAKKYLGGRYKDLFHLI